MKKSYIYFFTVCFSLIALTACTSPMKNASATQNDYSLIGKDRQDTLKIVKDYYYFNQLSNEEKENYLILRKKASQFKDTISLSPASSESIFKTIDAFVMDNPDLYWLTSAPYKIESSSSNVFVEFEVPEDAKETYGRLQDIGNQILAQAPKEDDYQKVLYFYNYIIKNTDYNKEAFDAFKSGDEALVAQNQDIKSVFMDHLSVCNGYAQAFQFLCQKAGIESLYVRGSVTSAQSQEEVRHAWNLVKLKNKFYAVDSTWGDPVFENNLSGHNQEAINYNFLCLPDKILNISHKASSDITYQDHKSLKNVWKYPVCDDDSLLYSKLNGYYADHFDNKILSKLLKNQLEEGKPNPALQMSSEADYKVLSQDIEANSQFYHNLFKAYWPQYTGFSYSTSPETYSISFSQSN
ncbi:S-layer protein [Streptococcus didelphis]|uniref:S-layer protein n=1 Tax=Streptococcus didelphis TaxID=102886 RepID=A0ABY9LFP2_9STRE|nr:transglutaminase domain-containing protein [Streptococcus didelphis]WMB27732.1 S-layer protein [Streptococcus didelphis]WMB29807.1 S-layer protein [Streptococcus didelphis]